MSPARRSSDATEELRASLLERAERLVARDGPAGLTMRSLAADAGCAVGLIYKVFANREDLVVELISREFIRLRREFDDLVAAAGSRTVGQNLGRYAQLLLSSPAARLSHSVSSTADLREAIDAKAHQSGVVAALETTVADYLAAEQRIGRVDAGVDTHAFGFVISGAVHNLLVSGDPYPRPSRRQLDTMLAAVAARLVPHTQRRKPDADAD